VRKLNYIQLFLNIKGKFESYMAPKTWLICAGSSPCHFNCFFFISFSSSSWNVERKPPFELLLVDGGGLPALIELNIPTVIWAALLINLVSDKDSISCWFLPNELNGFRRSIASNLPSIFNELFSTNYMTTFCNSWKRFITPIKLMMTGWIVCPECSKFDRKFRQHCNFSWKYKFPWHNLCVLFK